MSSETAKTSFNSDAELIEKWSHKLDPAQILAKKVDGRTITGLEKLVDRLAEDASKRKLHSALKNFKKVVNTAQSLAKQKITAMDSVELETALGVMTEHNVELPESLCKDLVERHTLDLLDKNDFGKFMIIMNPFMPLEAFSPSFPMMRGINVPIASKITTFSEVVVEKVLVDWLKKGHSGADQVLEICKLALDAFSEVDLLDLETAPAKEFADQLNVWKGCISLLSDDFEGEAQDKIELDAVLKIKAAMTKTNHSPLTLVATTIDAQEWWSQLLQNYIVEMPAMQEWLPQMTEHNKTLGEIELTKQGLSNLCVIVKDIPALTNALRAKRIDEFVKNVIGHVMKMCQCCLEEGHHHLDNQESTTECQGLLKELLTVQPLNDALQAMALSLDMKFQQQSTASELKQLWDTCKEFNAAMTVADTSGKNEKGIKGILDRMLKSMSAVTAEMGGIEGNMTLAFEEAWTHMAILLAKHFFKLEITMPSASSNQIIAVLTKFTSCLNLPNPAFKVTLGLLETALDTQQKWVALQPSQDASLDDIVSKDLSGNKVSSLKRCLLHLSKDKAEVEKAVADNAKLMEAYTVFNTFFEEANRICQKVLGSMSEKANAEIKSSLSDLQSISGGKKGGLWTDGLAKSATWKTLKDSFKSNKLFDVKPTELVEKIAGLEKACCLKCTPRWFGRVVDEVQRHST
eukprot:6492309-Amphidinium_carterae.4